MTYDEAASWLESVHGTYEGGPANDDQDEVVVQVGRMSRRVAFDRVEGPHVAKQRAAQKAFAAACKELRETLESAGSCE
jgi:hypothetical protein